MAKNVGILKPFEVESIHLIPQDSNSTMTEGDVYGVPAYLHNMMGLLVPTANFPWWQIEFDPDAEERQWWEFTLPRNFLKQHQVNVKLYWMSETKFGEDDEVGPPVVTYNDVVWGASVLGRKECEAFDAALGTEVTVVDAVHATAKSLVVTTITLPPAKHELEGMDVVVLQVARKATHDDDTHKHDALLVMVDFEFARDPEILRGF